MPVNERQPPSSVIADASPQAKIEPTKEASLEFQQHSDMNFECQNSDSDSSYPSFFRTPSPTSTPALSSASDTDTESEAPSTSNPPSPDEPANLSMLSSSSLSAYSELHIDQGAINSYFPLLPQSSSLHSETMRTVPPNMRPGQTPPLSMIYPEYVDADSLPTPSIDDLEVGLSNFVNKVKLQAIPSPSLAPPSPFSLYPPSKNASPVEERFARSHMGSQGQMLGQSGVMTKRAFAAARSRSALSLSSIPIPPSLSSEAEEQLGPSFSRRKELKEWS